VVARICGVPYVELDEVAEAQGGARAVVEQARVPLCPLGPCSELPQRPAPALEALPPLRIPLGRPGNQGHVVQAQDLPAAERLAERGGFRSWSWISSTCTSLPTA